MVDMPSREIPGFLPDVPPMWICPVSGDQETVVAMRRPLCRTHRIPMVRMRAPEFVNEVVGEVVARNPDGAQLLQALTDVTGELTRALNRLADSSADGNAILHDLASRDDRLAGPLSWVPRTRSELYALLTLVVAILAALLALLADSPPRSVEDLCAPAREAMRHPEAPSSRASAAPDSPHDDASAGRRSAEHKPSAGRATTPPGP